MTRDPNVGVKEAEVPRRSFSRLIMREPKSSACFLLPFTVTKPVTNQEIIIALDARDARFGSWELAKSNAFSVPLLPVRNPQTVPLGVDKPRTSPQSAIREEVPCGAEFTLECFGKCPH